MERELMINRLDELGVSRAEMVDQSDSYLERRLELLLNDAATVMAMEGLRRQDAGRVTRFDGSVSDVATERLAGRCDAGMQTENPRSSSDWYGIGEARRRDAALGPEPVTDGSLPWEPVAATNHAGTRRAADPSVQCSSAIAELEAHALSQLVDPDEVDAMSDEAVDAMTATLFPAGAR